MVSYDLCILFTLLILVQNCSSSDDVKLKPPINPDKFKVHFMEANSTYNFKPFKRGFFERHCNTYCYSGNPKSLGRLLETIELYLEIEGDDYTQYDGTTPQEVEEHYSEHRSLFSFSLFSQKRSRLSLSPFMQQCIGIETIQPYSVRLLQERFDYMRLVMLLGGIVIFLFAGHLSSNSIFYYITGVLFGICSSFLLLIWLSGKLMPKRAMMYGVVIGGWTIGLYVIRMLWHNLQMIMVAYRNYVCWYIIITGMVSFLCCYRWGPPKNRRSKNIIKWLLQLMSLTLIYLSSNFKEAISAIIAITVILYYFPPILKSVLRFRGKTSRNISSQRELHNTGNTTMMSELRNDCKQWGFNNPQDKEWKINKPSSRLTINNTSSIMDARNSAHSVEREPSQIESDYADDTLSDLDMSASGNNVSNEKLYPLPDGTFLLSKKPPKIFTQHHLEVTPIYHRSTPDITPKLHHRLPLAVANARRLTSASSTSELFVKRGRSNIQSPSQFQRSSSVQRIQSRSLRLVASAKKNIHGSCPKIQIEKPETDESEG